MSDRLPSLQNEHYIPVRLAPLHPAPCGGGRLILHPLPQILPDLSDLYEKIEWARSHPEEAARIQAAGKEVVTRCVPSPVCLGRFHTLMPAPFALFRLITDDQLDAYYYLVLLELSQLQRGWSWSNGTEAVDLRPLTDKALA